jgi:hypothetical protein
MMIAGAGRSGSTLLERILATAPGTVTVGELTEIWQRGLLDDELCGCGRPFSECGFWADVGERAFGGWDRIDPGRMIALERKLGRSSVPLSLASGRSAAIGAALEEYGSALAAIYRAVAERSGAATIIDASKWPRHLFVLRRIPVELRVIHLFRDPRAVALSWSRETPKPHGAGAEPPRMHTYRPAGSALRWLAFNLLVDLAGRLGTPTRRVRYEALVEDPARVLPDLVADLDVGATIASVPLDPDAGGVTLAPTHGIAGNPMRFRHGLVELRNDEDWRSTMPAAQRLAVTAICGPLHQHYVRDCVIGSGAGRNGVRSARIAEQR